VASEHIALQLLLGAQASCLLLAWPGTLRQAGCLRSQQQLECFLPTARCPLSFSA